MIQFLIASYRRIHVALRSNLLHVSSLYLCVFLFAVPRLSGQEINVTAVPGSSYSIGTLYFSFEGPDFSQAITCPDNSDLVMVPYVFSDFEFFDINNQPMLIPGTGYIWTDPDGPCDSIPTNLNFVLTEPTFSMTVTPLQIEGDPNTWSGAAVLTPILVPGVNVFYPKYYVLSLLYAAPGNMSSDGFTDAQTQGATSSISETFTQGTTTSASFGFLIAAKHHGLSSLGWVMCVGTACIYLASLLVLRPILLWRLKRKGVYYRVEALRGEPVKS